MPDKLHAYIEETLRAAREHRKRVAKIEKHVRENPEPLATRIVEVVPESLKQTRVAVLEEFGVDIADAESVRNFKTDSVVEWQEISRLTTRHQIYSAFLRLVGQYFRDSNLTGVRSARAVCDAFLEATEWQFYAVALDFDELRKKLPAAGFADEEFTKVLGAVVASRTRLDSNPPLKDALAILSGEAPLDEPSHREQRAQWLKRMQTQFLHELLAALQIAYSEGGPEGGLSGLRKRAINVIVEQAETKNEAKWREEARRFDVTREGLEKDDAMRVNPLAERVAREAASERNAMRRELVNQIKFSPQQQRIIGLLEQEPDLLHSNGDIAAEEVAVRLEMSPNQVSVQWRRIREKALEQASGA